jgi:hypothetical protein
MPQSAYEFCPAILQPGDSPMSKRKHLALRTSSGKIARRVADTMLPPTQIRRLLDAASTGLRDGMWGSTLGRLYLTQKIAAAELSAGQHWATLVTEYSQSLRYQATANRKLRKARRIFYRSGFRIGCLGSRAPRENFCKISCRQECASPGRRCCRAGRYCDLRAGSGADRVRRTQRLA